LPLRHPVKGKKKSAEDESSKSSVGEGCTYTEDTGGRIGWKKKILEGKKEFKRTLQEAKINLGALQSLQGGEKKRRKSSFMGNS